MDPQQHYTKPIVVRDPRFEAGRQTIGTPTSVDLFALLLEQTRAKFGAESLETAPAYYEYGNALFRVAQRRNQQEDDEHVAVLPKQQESTSSGSNSRAAAAAAAERRAKQLAGIPADGDEEKKPAAAATTEDSGNGNEQNPDDEQQKKESAAAVEDADVLLALEMMETAYAILDRAADDDADQKYAAWIREQLPRVLTGLGDVQSALSRHADAAHAYLHAREHRQEALQAALERTKNDNNDNNNNNNTDHGSLLHLLTCRRRVVEIHTLIVEELLACDSQRDVVTTEAQLVLVPKGQIVEHATGYYERAREELQEAVLLLGQLAAASAEENVSEEKENVCFAATLVMAAGEALAAMDDATKRADEPAKKKAKKV